MNNIITIANPYILQLEDNFENTKPYLVRFTYRAVTLIKTDYTEFRKALNNLFVTSGLSEPKTGDSYYKDPISNQNIYMEPYTYLSRTDITNFKNNLASEGVIVITNTGTYNNEENIITNDLTYKLLDNFAYHKPSIFINDGSITQNIYIKINLHDLLINEDLTHEEYQKKLNEFESNLGVEYPMYKLSVIGQKEYNSIKKALKKSRNKSLTLYRRGITDIYIQMDSREDLNITEESVRKSYLDTFKSSIKKYIEVSKYDVLNSLSELRLASKQYEKVGLINYSINSILNIGLQRTGKNLQICSEYNSKPITVRQKTDITHEEYISLNNLDYNLRRELVDNYKPTSNIICTKISLFEALSDEPYNSPIWKNFTGHSFKTTSAMNVLADNIIYDEKLHSLEMLDLYKKAFEQRCLQLLTKANVGMRKLIEDEDVSINININLNKLKQVNEIFEKSIYGITEEDNEDSQEKTEDSDNNTSATDNISNTKISNIKNIIHKLDY